jgi:DNA-directed RNA polymerase specialized sigma24 family protein
MDRPDQAFADWAKEYEQLVAQAAWRFSSAAEYDDLYQEGLIALWKIYPDADSSMVGTAVYNRMKDWVRYITRLNRNQNVSYEEIVDGTLHNGAG